MLEQSFRNTLITVGKQLSETNQPMSWLGAYQIMNIAQGTVSSAIQVAKSYTHSEPEAPYNSYKWGFVPDIDAYTKQPIYSFKVYKDRILVGTALFFGTTELCAGINGDLRTNVLEATGVLTPVLGRIEPQQSCARMPFTYNEAMIYEFQQGCSLGATRGLGRVTEWQMSGHISKVGAWVMGKTMQYGLYFARFYY